MTEVKEGMRAFMKELHLRCLYDPLEFLFKINIAEEFPHSAPSNYMGRAMNLFSMREYYQVYCILKCDSNQAKMSYNFCICCSKERIFLRNYAIYILSTIKGVKEPGIVMGAVKYEDESINKILGKMQSGKDSFMATGSFALEDPFLLYLLLVAKRECISIGNLKKGLFMLIGALPYFWDGYRLIADLITVSDCAEVLDAISDPVMRRVFGLYIGSRKCILHKELKAFMESYESEGADLSLYEQSLMASVLGHYKKNTRAIEVLEGVVEKSQDWSGFDQFSNILYSLKDSERLGSLLFKVFEQFGNLPIYNYVAGNMLALKADHVGSIEEFQKIIHDDCLGEFDIAYIFVAQEYFHLKDTCSAIKACNLAIKKNYNDHRVWMSMAQIYFSIEMHEYALHFYRKCAELSPDTPAVYEGLGLCFDKLTRWDEAARCYKRCIEQGSTKALCLLGDLFFQQNDPRYQEYYKEYLMLSFSLKDPIDAPDVNMKTAERMIECLEASVDSHTILQWRKSLTVLRNRIGS
ncbi:anaphase-promoting complex subunit 8 [Nematocida major]|uniref:anaphase-promoting complex subunit 8 n=1 Tax=Nematocida major TaxID=1912982 RepID=UPI002007AF5D|nr:anaphase-promoting complex subunit 8 [Nematocida major]KAH9385187.1 anaphase-promoting complex subunit 8 [Nematocida major]